MQHPHTCTLPVRMPVCRSVRRRRRRRRSALVGVIRELSESALANLMRFPSAARRSEAVMTTNQHRSRRLLLSSVGAHDNDANADHLSMMAVPSSSVFGGGAVTLRPPPSSEFRHGARVRDFASSLNSQSAPSALSLSSERAARSPNKHNDNGGDVAHLSMMAAEVVAAAAALGDRRSRRIRKCAIGAFAELRAGSDRQRRRHGCGQTGDLSTCAFTAICESRRRNDRQHRIGRWRLTTV